MKDLKLFNLLLLSNKYSTLTKVNVILVITLLICNITYSQKKQFFEIPDSLKNKTYEELYKSYNLNYNNFNKAELYANNYLHKAKNENDTIKIANGYSQLASILYNSKFDTSLNYYDSIILLTKNIKNDTYPGFGFLIKGIYFNKYGKYKKALTNYLIAQKYATNNNNLEQLFYIKNEIGQLKYFWGNYNEALNILKSQLNLLQNQNFIVNNKDKLYLSTLHKLSNAYIVTKKYDSALIYCKIGLQKSWKNKEVSYYDFLSQTGYIAYYQNDFKKALDSIDKAIPFETNANGLFNDYYYKGKIYEKQNKDTNTFYYFTKADSIYNATQDVVPEVREIQEYFIQFYKKNNDIENQLKYINNLLHVDSLINNNLKLNNVIIKEYDTPLLIAEKQKIILELKSDTKKSSIIIYALAAFVLLVVIFIFYFISTQRTYKKRFKKLLSTQKKEINTEIIKKIQTEANEVPEDVFNSIILELNKFEANEGYLNNKITLKTLASLFKTNSTYLSKTINLHTKNNFSTYISSLRIDYCVEKLKSDSTFRKYTIKAIAQEIGFNNTESFSKSFFKKTGIYPSYFIKELEKQKVTKKTPK